MKPSILHGQLIAPPFLKVTARLEKKCRIEVLHKFSGPALHKSIPESFIYCWPAPLRDRAVTGSKLVRESNPGRLPAPKSEAWCVCLPKISTINARYNLAKTRRNHRTCSPEL